MNDYPGDEKKVNRWVRGLQISHATLGLLLISGLVLDYFKLPSNTRQNSIPLGGRIAILLFGIALLMIAYGAHKRRPWARRVGRVLNFPILILFPIGTIIGAWNLWRFSRPEIKAAFAQRTIES